MFGLAEIFEGAFVLQTLESGLNKGVLVGVVVYTACFVIKLVELAEIGWVQEFESGPVVVQFGQGSGIRLEVAIGEFDFGLTILTEFVVAIAKDFSPGKL